MSFLTHLECSACNLSFDPTRVQTFCLDCQAPLLARYDLTYASQKLDREEIFIRPRGMWRWKEMLPIYDYTNIVSLGEGDVPLLPLPRLGAEIGVNQLYVKDESLNPTGSFKARGMSAAVSKAKELGINKLIIPTAGNAGGALAAYAARGGLSSYIIMPIDSPRANIEESRITGASVELVDGLISDAARMVNGKARSEDWFDLSTFKEPYRVEGKKIMGYELAEAFHWTLPNVIIYPTGGGTGLVGMWKAFSELDALGWLESKKQPRLVAVQAAGCAPVIKSFHTGLSTCDYWDDAHTIASGLRVPKSFADRIILHDLRESNGNAIAVDDGMIITAQRLLASLEGIFSAPEGAATVAALIILSKQGWIDQDEKIVLFNTGTGLKYI